MFLAEELLFLDLNLVSETVVLLNFLLQRIYLLFKNNDLSFMLSGVNLADRFRLRPVLQHALKVNDMALRLE